MADAAQGAYDEAQSYLEEAQTLYDDGDWTALYALKTAAEDDIAICQGASGYLASALGTAQATQGWGFINAISAVGNLTANATQAADEAQSAATLAAAFTATALQREDLARAEAAAAAAADVREDAQALNETNIAHRNAVDEQVQAVQDAMVTVQQQCQAMQNTTLGGIEALIAEYEATQEP